MNGHGALAVAVAEFASQIPYETAVRLVDAITGGERDAVRLGALAHDPDLRNAAVALIEGWHSTRGIEASEFASLLRGAAEAVRLRAGSEAAELVWTGPTSPRASFRRTDEALLEVVRAAHRTLTLMTFAAYRVPDVRVALSAALDRGVEVRFVGETEEGGEALRFDAALALGEGLAARVRQFEWPRELRERDRRGMPGSLHAKSVLADDSILLVSSANLTESAFGCNIEMGVLISGGSLPKLAARHFDELIRDGIFRLVG